MEKVLGRKDVFALAWLLALAAVVAQGALERELAGARVDPRWLLEWRALPILIWAAASPWILDLGGRFPVGGRTVARDLAIHAGAAGAWVYLSNVLMRLPGVAFGASWTALPADALEGAVRYGPGAVALYAALALLGRTVADRRAATGERAGPARPASEADDGPGAAADGRLALREGLHIHLVPRDEVRWVEADSDHVRVHVDGRSFRVRGTMRAFERELTCDGFLRVHRSALVHPRAVREIQPYFHGDYVAVLMTAPSCASREPGAAPSTGSCRSPRCRSRPTSTRRRHAPRFVVRAIRFAGSSRDPSRTSRSAGAARLAWRHRVEPDALDIGIHDEAGTDPTPMSPLPHRSMCSRTSRSRAARRFRPAVVALMAVAVAPWPRPAPARSQETAMFRVDPAHTGVFDEPPLRSYGGLAWRVQTGGAIRSTPLVAAGRLFIGSVDGHVHALDARTGDGLWRFRARTAVDASPAVHEGTLYVTDRAGTLYALDAATGRLHWTVDTGPELPLPWGFESGDLYTSSPVLADGRVYFGSGDGRVYAVDAATGAVAWSAETGGRVRSTPAVHAGRVFVGSADGVVYAFDATDGSPVWRHETEGAGLDSGDFGYDRRTIQSSPAVTDGRLFVGARDGRLYALDADTGERLWRSPERISWVNGAPAVSNGVVYAATSDQQFVQAVDAATGEERWRVPTAGIVWTSPALAGDQVIVAEGAGRVRGLDRETGEERWAAWTGDRLFGSPVPAGGLVYVGALDGGVYAFRDGNGAPFHRAVFWDSAYVEARWFEHHEPLARWLDARGYERLDAGGLESFLAARIEDREPGAVVFALDHVPDVAAAGGRESLFRRYLDAGGTVVWPSLVPLLWRRDPADGASGDFLSIDRTGAGEALSIDVDAVNFDPLGAFSTPAGVALGLPPDGWQTAWTVDPAPDLVPLATDENGRLASWRRRYGGPPGSGLVRLWGARSPVFDPAVAMAAAELRPLGEER